MNSAPLAILNRSTDSLLDELDLNDRLRASHLTVSTPYIDKVGTMRCISISRGHHFSAVQRVLLHPRISKLQMHNFDTNLGSVIEVSHFSSTLTT